MTLPDVEPGNSGVVIDVFPYGSPGATIAGPCEDMDHVVPESIWYPFRSQCDWELALWAKTRGSTSSAVSDLLAIPEVSSPPFPLAGLMPLRKVVNKLDLSFRTTNELNDIIDNEMSGPPPFQCKELDIGHELLQFFFCDSLQCVRSIYGNPDFTQDLVFAPERHYTDETRTCRVINEMHTGDWWWNLQVRKRMKFY